MVKFLTLTTTPLYGERMSLKLFSISKPVAAVLMSMAILSFATHAIGADHLSNACNQGIYNSTAFSGDFAD